MQAFRSFGGAKAGIDKKILEEIEAVIQKIQKLPNPVDVADITLKLASNVISNILFSERFGYENEIELIGRVKDWYDALNVIAEAGMFFPDWVIPIFMSKQKKAFVDATTNLEKYIEKQVKFCIFLPIAKWIKKRKEKENKKIVAFFMPLNLELHAISVPNIDKYF